MDECLIYETSTVINGTTYIVRSIIPSKDDIKVIKNKIKKLILNNLENKDNKQKNIRLMT
ncbi:MAG TPA: hypothetical protein PLH82_03735 [Candidatus Paceibacterota bacterium]|nr:hypothetical protein [Candidatus Paceibacterota bacterium]